MEKEKNIKIEKKKYWLKMEKEFLNSNHIKVIKNMKNGNDYIIFYLALMLASVSTEGHLKFSDIMPYNEDMLASITDSNIDTVRCAVKIFESLGLIRYLEDGTIFLPDVPVRIGKEGESAERVRIFREKQHNEKQALQCNKNVTKKMLHCSHNKEKDKEEDKEKDKETNKEVLESELNKIKNTNLKTALTDFIKMRNENFNIIFSSEDLYLLLERLNNLSTNIETQINILKQSSFNKWKDIYEIKQTNKQKENKDYKQKEYAKEDLNSLYDNIDEVLKDVK